MNNTDGQKNGEDEKKEKLSGDEKLKALEPKSAGGQLQLLFALLRFSNRR